MGQEGAELGMHVHVRVSVSVCVHLSLPRYSTTSLERLPWVWPEAASHLSNTPGGPLDILWLVSKFSSS